MIFPYEYKGFNKNLNPLLPIVVDHHYTSSRYSIRVIGDEENGFTVTISDLGMSDDEFIKTFLASIEKKDYKTNSLVDAWEFVKNFMDKQSIRSLLS